MKATGVFATPEETEEARRMFDVGPLIFPNGMRSAEAMDTQIERARAWLDELAQKHGLPAPGLIDGEVNHYGMSAKGEFVSEEP